MCASIQTKILCYLFLMNHGTEKHFYSKRHKSRFSKERLDQRLKLSKANTNSCTSCLIQNLRWNSRLQMAWEDWIFQFFRLQHTTALHIFIFLYQTNQTIASIFNLTQLSGTWATWNHIICQSLTWVFPSPAQDTAFVLLWNLMS